jgi:hypothetical protein
MKILAEDFMINFTGYNKYIPFGYKLPWYVFEVAEKD